jgi:hypothetical protein
MSESDIPRDPESGQFASADPGYGRDFFEYQQGYTQLGDSKPKDDDGPPVVSSDNDGINQAGQYLEAQREAQRGKQAKEPTVIELQRLDDDGRFTGEKVDPKVTTTLRQSTAMRADYTRQSEAIAEAAADRALKNELDSVRIGLEVTEPDVAKLYGFQNENARAVAEFHRDMGSPELPPAPTAETNTQSATPAVDGLDSELAKAMAHPQVREAIEAELARAHEAKAGYEAKIEEANSWARASLVHEFEELGRLPVDQWQNALMTIQAQDPVRFQKGIGVINQVQRVSAEQARIANEHAARAQQLETARQQELANWSRAESERYEKWAQREGLDMSTFAPAAGRYIETHLGMSRAQFSEVLRANPALQSSEFQQVLSDAVRYRQVQEARKAVERTPLPPAIRPGSNPGAASTNSNASRIADLTRQLNNASGQKALRIAAALTSARRKG